MWKEHFVKHWKVYAVILVVVVNIASAGSALAFFRAWNDTKAELATANNVIAGQVNEIQDFNAKLGVAESDLRRQEDLVKKYEKEVESMDHEFLEMVDEYKLKLSSRDSTIAGLRGKLKGGNTSTTVVEERPDGTFETVVDVREICDGKTIAYEWQDQDERFHLKDPDIANSGDEVFNYQQFVSIKGFVFADESGDLQVKKVEVKEVLRRENDETGEITYEEVPGGKVAIAESRFEYTNNSEEEEGWRWLDPITLRPVAFIDTALTPGIGLEVVNLGRWIPWANVGLVPKVAFDLSDPLGGSLQQSRLGVGVVYHLVPPLVNTNFAIGASVSTPFNNLGQWVFTVDATFYLTQDLFPESLKQF